jgi:hypothetical protein
MIKRRQFIAGLGSAAALPVVARAQQSGMRRIGVLIGTQENDRSGKPRLSAFTQALADLGWTDGRNMRIDLRWGGGDNNQIRLLAQELVALQPGRRDPSDCCVPARDADNPDRLCERARSHRQSHCCTARPSERERHWIRHLGNLAGR